MPQALGISSPAIEIFNMSLPDVASVSDYSSENSDWDQDAAETIPSTQLRQEGAGALKNLDGSRITSSKLPQIVSFLGLDGRISTILCPPY